MDHVYTSVRLAKPLHDKWSVLAEELGITRNQVINRLLEGAEVKSRPQISVKLNENRNAPVVRGERIAVAA